MMTSGNLGDMKMRQQGVKKRKPTRPTLIDRSVMAEETQESREPSTLQSRVEEKGMGAAGALKKKKKTGLGARAKQTYGA